MSYLLPPVYTTASHSVMTVIPDKQLLDQSLYIVSPEKPFEKWSSQDHADSYTFMQRIAQAWKRSNYTHQYLMCGKVDSGSFIWEMVPYQKCKTCLGRIIQQLLVLWRTIFGGFKPSNKTIEQQKLLTSASEPVLPSPSSCKSEDAFCKEETIDRQWVIKGGKVNVLFNYAPIGFGGERLHFLVVPKQHREAFTDLTQEEYTESLTLTQKLIDHFKATREMVKNVYLLNKTGVDAGQTVNHWHLHVIFSTNAAQTFWGRLTVVKNILLGSSPMKKEELAKKVASLRQELADSKI